MRFVRISEFSASFELKGIRNYLVTHKKQAIVVICLAGVGSTAYAALKVFLHPIDRDGRETRMNVIIKVPYGSVAVQGGGPPDKSALIEMHSDDEGDQPSMHTRYTYNPIGTIGTLRVTLGSDEGMLDRPKEYATGSWARSADVFASAPRVETDAGSYLTTPVEYHYSPTPAPSANSDAAISRIYLNSTIPLSLYSSFGFGESVLDLSGLSVLNATIESSASRTHIISRAENPVGMDACRINAGLGECVVEGICNFNCKTFSFSGGVGYCELHFTGNLQKNLDATVEVGCGKVVMNIPPTAGRVQVYYDDNLFSSFACQGLNKRKDGYYTSVGFEQSLAPVLTLRLSSGVGKMVVNYR